MVSNFKRLVFLMVLAAIMGLFISGCGKPTEDELSTTVLGHIKKHYDADVNIIDKELKSGEGIFESDYIEYTLKYPYSNFLFEAQIKTNGDYIGDNFPKCLYYDDIHNIMKSIIYLLEGNEAAANAHKYRYTYNYELSNSSFRSLHEFLQGSESYITLDVDIQGDNLDEAISKAHALIDELVKNSIYYSMTLNISINGEIKVIELQYHRGDSTDYTNPQDIIKKIK